MIALKGSVPLFEIKNVRSYTWDCPEWAVIISRIALMDNLSGLHGLIRPNQGLIYKKVPKSNDVSVANSMLNRSNCLIAPKTCSVLTPWRVLNL